jgi:DNA-binding SARP family transcriptional activator
MPRSNKKVALAKLTRPRLHDVLTRTRLHELLDAAGSRPVVWLVAQPGAGKTTLVAGWLDAGKRSGIWYQVDAADADPASFVYHLRLAAAALDAPAAERLPLLTPEYLPDLRGFARRFFRDLFACVAGAAADSTAAVVLDNFQDVPDDSAFHRLVTEAMAQVPPGVQVIVISRAEPSPAYASLLAGDAIALVDAAALRLTLDETEAIARRRGVVADALVEQLHERSQGWAAGLTLLLLRARQAAALAAHDDSESLQHVFGYFAQRVFDDAPDEQRQALMQLSFLPSMTPALAEALTAMPGVVRLLEQFYRRHLFTDRRRTGNADGVAFQFHALFRTFLQHQARATWSDEACRGVAARAAALLEAAGEAQAALPLLAQAGEWAGYGRLVAQRAEDWLGQGRAKTVVDALARMPVASRDEDPWLGYWQGRALMLLGGEQAPHVLEASHARFAERGDAAGQLACGAAIVQTVFYARLAWSEVTPWIERLESAMAQRVEFPTRSVELLTRSALHAALTFCRPAHPAIGPAALVLLRMVGDAGIAWPQRLSAATHLVTFLHNTGDHDRVAQLTGQVDALAGTLPAPALSRAFWLVFSAFHEMRLGHDEAATARFQQAEDIGAREGLPSVEFAALQFRIYHDLMFRRTDEAQARLVRLEANPARGAPESEINIAVAKAILAQQLGDAQAALGHAQRALQAIARVGAMFFQIVFPVLLASIFADAGKPARALGLIDASRRWSRGSYMEAMDAQLLLEEAYVALSRGDADTARARLAEGLALAATDATRMAYVHRAVVRKPVLLETALAAGIEVDLVRGLVRRWRLPPPAEDIAAWPWPIKVRTLGAFDVLRDDAPIEFGRKAPKKTLALLKLIVARGGSVPESAVLDTFWPDEQGDAAQRSLGAAVRRLRDLLGDPEAVVQQGGQLSLDRGRVWVDAWAFERALARPGDTAAAEALTLYRGAFLAEVEGQAWPVALRERLRSKFIQAVAQHASRLESAQRDEDAIVWYLRGLDADNVVEPFYQGLMRCYHRLDRLPEAVSAYRRLKQTLSVTLSLPPSAGTEKLYRSLRLD